MTKTEYLEREIRKLYNPRQNSYLCDTGIDSYEIREGYFDFDIWLPTKKVNLQRPLVWTDRQKGEYIAYLFTGNWEDSIITVHYHDDNDSDFPKYAPHYIGKYAKKKDVIQVIDGKQRLNAIIDFNAGKVPMIYNGHEFYAKDLPKHTKMIPFVNSRRFYAYELFRKMRGEEVDETLIKIFCQFNFAGTPQTQEHRDTLESLLVKKTSE